MSFTENAQNWLVNNKKSILIGGMAVLSLVGSVVGFAFHKNNKISFPEWLKTAPKEELEEAYEQLRQIFCKTGTRPFGMEQISHELGDRGAKEWFEKHPPNLDPNFRWTDANRWDRD